MPRRRHGGRTPSDATWPVSGRRSATQSEKPAISPSASARNQRVGIEHRRADGEVLPLLEGGRHVVPVVGERVHDGVVDGTRLSGLVRAHGDAARPHRLLGLILEIDPHSEEMTDEHGSRARGQRARRRRRTRFPRLGRRHRHRPWHEPARCSSRGASRTHRDVRAGRADRRRSARAPCSGPTRRTSRRAGRRRTPAGSPRRCRRSALVSQSWISAEVAPAPPAASSSPEERRDVGHVVERGRAQRDHASSFSNVTLSLSTFMPDALVEPRGAGRVLRVDAERHTRDAALPEHAEGVKKQRAPQAALPPIAADADHADEAAAVPPRLTPRVRGDALAVSDDEPEALVVVGAHLPPLLERHRDEAPLVRERLRDRVVELPRLLLAEGVHAMPVGELGCRRLRVEVDRHLVVPPCLAIAACLHERPRARVGSHRV